MFYNVKKLLKKVGLGLVVSVLVVNFAWAKDYEGFGSTREAAREDLAQQIIVTVKSRFESETKVEENALTKSFSSSANASSSQSSNVILTGVVVTQTESGEFKATLNKQQFRKDAELTLDKVLAACETELPTAWQPRRRVLAQCMQDVDAAMGMAKIVGKQTAINSLSQLRTNIYNENDKALVVISSTPEVGYSLDGKTFSYGKSHQINSGEHTIIWQSEDFCKFQQTFTVKAGEEKSFNPKLGRSPQITFLSPNLDATLTVNGKTAKLGEVYKRSECNGEILSYSISNSYDSKTGNIKLKPNLKEKINARLLTEDELARKKQREEAAEQKLKARQEKTSLYTQSFTNLNAWQLLYGYSTANNYENTHRLRLEKVNNFSALRYGWGAMYGSSENSSEYEAYAQIALQLPEIGGYPLNIYGWSFVPYGGAELGLGYHERYHEKNKVKTHKFEDKSKFSRDTLVVRYLVGLDIPVSQHLAIKFQASKQTSMEKSIEFNLGASILF